MRLVLFGPPGSGKGTQAERLCARFAVPHLSTGDMLRAAVARGTEVGKRAQAIMAAGELVPDEVVIGIVADRLAEADAARGFVLDGFPRTVAQAGALDGVLEAAGRGIDRVIALDVAAEALVERIAGRFACADCGAGYHDTFRPTAVPGVCDRCGSRNLVRRKDDRPETVRERLAAYRAQTAPLLPYYAARGTLATVDGMADIDAVAERIGALFETPGARADTDIAPR